MAGPLDDLPRWRGPLDPNPFPASEPWIADVHSFDLPNTIAMCVRNVPAGCVAVVLVDRGGPAMRAAAEQAALERGVKILWEDRVAAAETS